MHAAAHRPNEDRAAVSGGDSLAVAVVCDGAGSSAAGGIAAELVSGLLVKALEESFREFYFSDGAAARMRLIRMVTQRLAAYSRDRGIPERELACTILAAAMDEDGRCVCFHLGDGIIMQKDREDRELRVVSAPMNGLTGKSTYLTMNCEMWRYLRYCRWQSAGIEQLLLLTDGAAEHLVRRQGGAGWRLRPDVPADLEPMRRYLRRKNPADDCTAARITRKTD